MNYTQIIKQELKEINKQIKEYKKNNSSMQWDLEIDMLEGRKMEIKEYLEYSYE